MTTPKITAAPSIVDCCYKLARNGAFSQLRIAVNFSGVVHPSYNWHIVVTVSIEPPNMYQIGLQFFLSTHTGLE